ncbi:MAG TPA: chemotaxis protein CheX [Candidatus Binatia bacterium]|nr:chemotaxis protein CheX [Candidatus Binatia bacterium]
MKAATAMATGGNKETWIPLLELAAKEVFSLMLGTEISLAAPDTTAPPAVTAMVGLAGQLCGVLSIRCDQQSAVLMASKMLGLEPDKVGDEMSDAMGEISNMVAGNFKNKISGLGDGCMLSPPTVVTGNDYSLYALADSPAYEVSMLFEGAPFVISLQIHS